MYCNACDMDECCCNPNSCSGCGLFACKCDDGWNYLPVGRDINGMCFDCYMPVLRCTCKRDCDCKE